MAITVQLPENAVEVSSAYMWRNTNGIFVAIYKPQAVHDRDTALECIAHTVALNDDVMPELLLIDLTDIRSMSRDAREEYKTSSADENVKAIALVTESVVGRMIANFFLSFNKAKAPIKLFNNYNAAEKWLLTKK